MAKLSLILNNEEASYEFSGEDVSADELLTVLKGLMVAHTFPSKCIDNVIIEEAEEIKKLQQIEKDNDYED